MADISSPNTTTNANAVFEWLVSWGFRDNPFAQWEAGQEKELTNYFVKRPFFEPLFNDVKSAVVFAPRGGGKSAMRRMIQNESSPTLPSATTLVAPVTDFSQVAEGDMELSQLTLRHYLPILIKAIVSSTLEALAARPEALLRLAPDALTAWAQWVPLYALEELTSPRLLGLFLRRTRPSVVNDRLAQTLSSALRAGHPPLPDLNPTEAKIYRRLWDMRSGAPAQTEQRSALQNIQRLVETTLPVLATPPLMAQQIFVLIDGVDEYPLTQADARASAALLRPLLGSQQLLELPYLVLKFFLPAEQRAALLGVTRRDRLAIFDLRWDTPTPSGFADLRTLLRRRIAAFHAGGLGTLDEMCHPTLRHWLEGAMLEAAQSSPRRLLQLGYWLFMEHCRGQRVEPESEILPEDWERALQRVRVFDQDQPPAEDGPPSTVPSVSLVASSGSPRLRVDGRAKKAYRGASEIAGLSPLEYRLLEYLYRHQGQVCGKDELIQGLYDKNSWATTSDEAVSQLVKRLREKVEPNPAQPIYILTRKGRGYLLENPTPNDAP